MSTPVAVHLCKRCGHTIYRHEMTTVQIVSGVIQCPACGEANSLNICIIEPADKKPPATVE